MRHPIASAVTAAVVGFREEELFASCWRWAEPRSRLSRWRP